MHSSGFEGCQVKEYLVKLNRCRTTWCPTNGTGGTLPRSSRIPTSPTSAPASPSRLAVTTGKGPAAKTVRGCSLRLVTERVSDWWLGSEQRWPERRSWASFRESRGIRRKSRRWLSPPPYLRRAGCVVPSADRSQPPKVLSCLKNPEQ